MDLEEITIKKTEEIMQIIEEMNVNMTLLNRKNFNWSTMKVDKKQRKFISASKHLRMNHLDGKEHELTPNNYLPGGTLTTMFGNLSSYVVETSKTSDKIGQWNSIKLKHEKKIIISINIHRVPDGSRKGLKTYLSQ